MNEARSTKTRHWHYFTINVGINLSTTLSAQIISEELNHVLEVALKDYGIGMITTVRRGNDPTSYNTEAAVCYSTIEDHEIVIGDLFRTITVALLEGGYRFDRIAITHDLTEPHPDADAAFGADKFAAGAVSR